MTDGRDLHVKVRDDEIIVTLSGTNYLAVYYKSDNSPRLLARHFPKENDGRSLMGQSELLAMPARAPSVVANQDFTGRAAGERMLQRVDHEFRHDQP